MPFKTRPYGLGKFKLKILNPSLYKLFNMIHTFKYIFLGYDL